MGRIAEGLMGEGDRRRTKRAAKSFSDIANQPLSGIADYQKKAEAQSLPGLVAADKQTALALRESGVSGPQAGLERSRQAGIRGTKLDEALSKYALEDEMRRRDAQLQFYGAKGAPIA